MNYLKKMNDAIRLEAAGKGLIFGAVISVLLNVLMMVTGYDTGFLQPILSALMTGGVSAAVAVLLSLRRTGALTARVRSLERVSGRINDDQIRAISEDTAMGEHWLVHQDGTNFKVWTREMLRNIELDSQNPQAKKAVLKLTSSGGRTEKCVVAKSAALVQALGGWLGSEDRADNLTFGQM